MNITLFRKGGYVPMTTGTVAVAVFDCCDLKFQLNFENPRLKMGEKLPFCGYLTASGHGEVWDHTDSKKFNQFGWRCTTNETGYSYDTLIGNWNEERYDTKCMAKTKPVPSQYNHYFETTYDSTFKQSTNKEAMPAELRRSGGISSEAKTFPGHQPELHSQALKLSYNSFETTSMAAYKNPSTMR